MSLTEKIKEMKHALFFPGESSHFRYPVSIINIAHIDDMNHLWFFEYQPGTDNDPTRIEFPATLHFYRKGKNISIHIDGIARICHDQKEETTIPDWMRTISSEDLLLIRLKIAAAEVYDFNIRTNHSFFEKLKNYSKNWINLWKHPHQHKPFQFNTH